MPKSFARLNPISRKKIESSLRIGFGVLFIQCQTTQGAQEKSDQNLDWIEKDQLSPEQQAEIPPGCNGLYVDPLASKDSASDLLIKTGGQDIIVEADNAEVKDAKKARLIGDVVVQQGNTHLSASEMAFDHETEIATFNDNVTIRQPGLLIRGEKAEVKFKESQSTFQGATFVLHDTHIRGSADAVNQLSKDVVQLKNGSVTSCEPGSNGWALEGQTLQINRATNQGSGRNVKLKMGSVPVLYLPYITFPVGSERQSGFLFPSISSSEDGGLDIAVPYYWNIAPNYDATITPRLITDRGFMLETEFRHLNSWVNSEVRGAYLPDDKGSGDNDLQKLIDEGVITEDQANPNKGSDRWLVQLQQSSDDSFGWYIDTDFTKVSDVDYFRDLGSDSFSGSNNSQLNQIFLLGYRFPHWDIGASLENHQLLLQGIDRSYRKLPQIHFDGDYRFGDFATQFDHELTEFTRENVTDGINGTRFLLDYRVNWDRRKPWGFIKPEVGYKNLNYKLTADNNTTGQEIDENKNYDALQTSIDMGLLFERYAGDMVHTLEPRFYYLFREYENQDDLFNVLGDQDLNFDTFTRTFSYNQLFRDSRFIGSDRIDDANQFTLGLSSSMYELKSGEEKLRVSLGKIYYLDDRRVLLTEQDEDSAKATSSEIALETAIRFSSQAQLILSGIYDNKNQRTNRTTSRFHYSTPSKSHIFNAAYSQARGDVLDATELQKLEQIDLSTAIQINPQWAAMARANYDLHNEQELETFLGVEYDDCCYRVRVLARKWLDSNIAAVTDDQSTQYDTGIFLELHLKGLGGSGAKVNSILNDGIYGYRERETNRK